MCYMMHNTRTGRLCYTNYYLRALRWLSHHSVHANNKISIHYTYISLSSITMENLLCSGGGSKSPHYNSLFILSDGLSPVLQNYLLYIFFFTYIRKELKNFSFFSRKIKNVRILSVGTEKNEIPLLVFFYICCFSCVFIHFYDSAVAILQ